MITTKLYQDITQFMDEVGQRYDVDAEGGLVVAQIGGEHGTWYTYIQITDDDKARNVVIHAQLPARIPEINRVKVAELLTKINYDLLLGNFELGMADGEVLFKTAVDLADGVLTKAMFERLYMLNCDVMNEFYGEVCSLGFGDVGLVVGRGESRPSGMMLQ